MCQERFANRIHHVAFVLVVAALALPGPALGQQADSEALPEVSQQQEKRGGIEEIVVTSRKREESVQEVPVAVTAIAKQLREPAIRDLQDLNGYAPNVLISDDGTRPNNGQITIRGISPTRTDDNSFDSPIAVMIDNVYLGTMSGTVLENFDLERVEILRGPQGTLFGKNSVGGVINVIRSRPIMDWGVRFKVTGGSHELQEYRAVVNAPLIEDQLGVKFFGTLLKDDGNIRNSFLGRRVPERDYMNYGATFLWEPTDAFEAQFTIERFDDDSETGGSITNFNLAPGVAPGTDFAGGFLACTLFNSGIIPQWVNAGVPCRTSLSKPTTVATDLPNPAEFEVDAYTLNMRYDFSDRLSLVSVTGYRDMVEDRKLDFDGTEVDHITLERLNDFDQISQELRIEGTWNNVAYVAGAYYYKSEFEQDWVTGGDFWHLVGTLGVVTPPFFYAYDLRDNTWIGAPPAFTMGLSPIEACLDPAVRPLVFGEVFCDSEATTAGLGNKYVQRLFEEQETESYALFAQADWMFVEDWTLTLGLRWTQEEKDFTAAQAYLSSLARQRVKNFPGFVSLDKTWTELSPKVGLSWKFNEDIMFYGSYSEGFHSGGFFGVNQTAADLRRNQYDPEIAKSWEIGAKMLLFDRQLLFNLSYFYNDFEDKQEESVQLDTGEGGTGTVSTVFSNVADATYQGVELETRWVPTDYLELWASAGWLDAEYDDFETDVKPNDGLDLIEDASFLEPRAAPDWTFGGGINLNYPLGPGEAFLYSRYTWIDEVESDLLNEPFTTVDSRENVGAAIGYRWENWTVSVFGRNLTDDFNEIPFYIAPLFASGTLAPRGRTYGVEVTFDWQND